MVIIKKSYNYSELIRISRSDRKLLETTIKNKFIEEYPLRERDQIPHHELINFLIVNYLGVFYPKFVSEAIKNLNKHKS